MVLRIEVYDSNKRLINKYKVMPEDYSYFRDFSPANPDVYCIQCLPGNRASLIHKGKQSDKKFEQLEELSRGDTFILFVRTKDQQERMVVLSHRAA